jgi:hypothetical protein
VAAGFALVVSTFTVEVLVAAAAFSVVADAAPVADVAVAMTAVPSLLSLEPVEQAAVSPIVIIRTTTRRR